jgi:hypothetical protein
MRRRNLIKAIDGSAASQFVAHGRDLSLLSFKRWLVLVAVILFVAPLADSVVAQTRSESSGEAKRVLLLHSFGREFKPWSDYARVIRTELDQQSPWRIDLIDHSLVSARTSDVNPEKPFVDYLRALFAQRLPDLIISVGAPSAAFVQRNRQALFAETPMVFTAVEQRRVRFSNLTANDAVVSVRINYLAAFENMLRVLPDTKNIIGIIGASPIEKFWKEAISYVERCSRSGPTGHPSWLSGTDTLVLSGPSYKSSGSAGSPSDGPKDNIRREASRSDAAPSPTLPAFCSFMQKGWDDQYQRPRPYQPPPPIKSMISKMTRSVVVSITELRS